MGRNAGPLEKEVSSNLSLTLTNNEKIPASFFFPLTKPGYTVNISPFLRSLKHGLGSLGKRNSQMADNYLLTLAWRLLSLHNKQ